MKSQLKFLAAVFAIAFTLLIPVDAHAGLMSKVADLLSNNIDRGPNGDESFSMLHSVLGDFALDPFNTAAGSGGSLLAAMFKNYNMYVFGIAIVWFSYTCIAGLAQTMHEGVVLGRRMSTVWMPIRVIFGTASLIPAFGGWGFCQALMMIATLLGIAGANVIVKGAVDDTAGFNVTVNPMASVKEAAAVHDIELFLIKATTCSAAAEMLGKEMVDSGLVRRTSYPPSIVTNKDSIIMSFPGASGTTGCGQLRMQFSPRSNNGIRSMFGFRIPSVNYEGIRQAAMSAHLSALMSVYKNAEDIAFGISAKDVDGPYEHATDLIRDGYFGSYSKSFQSKLAGLSAGSGIDNNSSAISSELTEKMKSGGWATLGIWYSVYAEVNEAMNEMLDPVVTFSEPRESNSSFQDDAMLGLEGAISSAGSKLNPSSPSPGNVIGSPSVGQAILGKVIDGMAGSSSTGSSNTINPIIAFKNIGDNALSVAQTIYWLSKAASTVENVPGAGAASSAISSVGSVIKRVPILGNVVGTLSGVVSDIKELAVPIAFILFGAAVAMSIYIPMIPFIQWFAALIQWFSSIVESLLGASLWALAHFDAEGEGMGQRASYGYLYLMNNFSRPIIMTFAFFFASATITVMGTFLFKYYAPAVASAQGTSLTGLISIVGYLVLFAIMGITLVNGTFGMMLNLADRMIGWLGNLAHSAIGHDMENKINTVFVSAAKAGSGIRLSSSASSARGAFSASNGGTVAGGA